MLRDRYEPVDLFALVPQLGLEFDPQLAQLDRLLDDDQIFARVRADLARRYPLTGSTAATPPPSRSSSGCSW